jgi:protein-tyrosine phosphatase
MINFGRIEQNIFVGSAPQAAIDVDRLKKMKITSVVSLQSDHDFQTHHIDWPQLQSAYQQHDISVQRFPIIDFDETDLGNKLVPPVKTLNSLLLVGHRVYVHCNAGICRAPATVLGYLCHYRGMSMELGLQHIRLNRPQANPYRAAVLKALAQLQQD